MQIIPFPVHYQSVYTNFDISSFSLISCMPIRPLLEAKRTCVALRYMKTVYKHRWSGNKEKAGDARIRTKGQKADCIHDSGRPGTRFSAHPKRPQPRGTPSPTDGRQEGAGTQDSILQRMGNSMTNRQNPYRSGTKAPYLLICPHEQEKRHRQRTLITAKWLSLQSDAKNHSSALHFQLLNCKDCVWNMKRLT